MNESSRDLLHSETRRKILNLPDDEYTEYIIKFVQDIIKNLIFGIEVYFFFYKDHKSIPFF